MSEPNSVQPGPCCFCGQEIPKTVVDPCRVTAETAKGDWQAWFCHAACFRPPLVTDPVLEPEIF